MIFRITLETLERNRNVNDYNKFNIRFDVGILDRNK